MLALLRASEAHLAISVTLLLGPVGVGRWV